MLPPTETPKALTDLAYAEIKRDIIECAILPGARLTETYLEENYAYGRAAIRSALRSLIRDELVESMPRYGHIVAPVDRINPRSLFEVQMMLETETARLAAGHIDVRRLQSLDDVCATNGEATTKDQASVWLHANTAFHLEIARATANPLLARFVQQMFEQLERMLYSTGQVVDAVQLVAHSHGDIITPLAADDSSGAEAAARAQMSHVHDQLSAFLKSVGHPGFRA